MLEGLVLLKFLRYGKYVAAEDVKLRLFPRQFTLNASGEKGLPKVNISRALLFVLQRITAPVPAYPLYKYTIVCYGVSKPW